MDFTSEASASRYAAFSRSLAQAVVGFDFDGTLSEIVPDPAAARIHPLLPNALVEFASQITALAVITGRPARQAIALGGLDDLGARIQAAGGRLVVLGQYGNERWDAGDHRIIAPRPPAGLSTLARELPVVLRSAGASDVHVEEKGLAVAVHTRRVAEPQPTFDRLLPILTQLAADHGLTVEPGRLVIEIRGEGMDKGAAVRRLATEFDAGAFAFGGDDLGDLPAFDALDDLSASGLTTLKVGIASGEETRVTDRCDVIVNGPSGLPGLLRQLLSH